MTVRLEPGLEQIHDITGRRNHADAGGPNDATFPPPCRMIGDDGPAGHAPPWEHVCPRESNHGLGQLSFTKRAAFWFSVRYLTDDDDGIGPRASWNARQTNR